MQNPFEASEETFRAQVLMKYHVSVQYNPVLVTSLLTVVKLQ